MFLMPSFAPGVNFIIVLQAAFTCTDHESTKVQSSHQFFFALSVSVHTKAAHKTSTKLTPGSNTAAQDSRLIVSIIKTDLFYISPDKM